MGEAIARFREMTLAERRRRDEAFSVPLFDVEPFAARDLARACRRLLKEFEAGELTAAHYVRLLAALRKRAERHPKRSAGGQYVLSELEWLPPSMRDRPPGTIKALAEQAAAEALEWGPLFRLAESRVRALSRATTALRMVAPQRRAKALARWQQAFDALAPFIEEPPTAASTFEKQTGSSRGGRPPNDEALARDLLAGWKAFEPEDGRKTKERYLAQRPDVRVLKTEEARQRKIASLRVALDSALHLRREKTKQRRQARG